MKDKLFWAKVKNGPGGCWVWTGYRQWFGHGALTRTADGKPRTVLAHRHAWTLLKGPIPADKCLLHTCDNPPCVNPDHLYIGDRIDNAADRLSRGRAAKGEKLGRLTEADVLEIRRLKGKVRAGDLAVRFGVSRTHVYAIQHRGCWKHLSHIGDNCS